MPVGPVQRREEEHYLLVDDRNGLMYDAGAYDEQPEKCPCTPGLSFLGLIILGITMTILLYVNNGKTTLIFFIISMWLISLCLHEFGHAITAYYGGDLSVKDKGYLSLDVIHYTDMIGSLAIPVLILLLGGIGLPGGAVFVNLSRIRSRPWQTVVSLAGPFATFLCAVAICMIFVVHDRALGLERDMYNHDYFWNGWALCAFVHFTALVLNLFPVPPFDGFGAIHPWLPECAQDWLRSTLNYTVLSFAGLCAVFILFWKVPEVGAFLFELTTVFGVPEGLAQDGLASFRLF